MSIPSIIAKKRDKQTLTDDEILTFVKSVVDGTMQDTQIGAMLMAIYLNGLNDNETIALTRAMKDSGDVLEWPSDWRGKLIDKHSTGGVGDKISLVLAPVLAAVGYKVPMVSGRGLAHTGGTLDKLESIPGVSVSFSNEQMKQIIESAGCCIVGQTKELVPADKKLYAIRDVTGTVSSIGFIVASIISKKAAEHPDALILDVKCGKGGSLQTLDDAKILANSMVTIGNGLNINTTALITSMNDPIGTAVGNALEIAESLDCLHGRGSNDVMELVYALGSTVMIKHGFEGTESDARKRLEETIKNGEAARRFCLMCIGQGAEKSLAEKLCNKDTDVWTILPRAKHMTEVQCLQSGYVSEIDAMTCAIVSGDLGAGRKKSDDIIKQGVGLQLQVSIGSKVNQGDIWVKVYHEETSLNCDNLNKLQAAIKFSEQQPKAKSRVIEGPL